MSNKKPMVLVIAGPNGSGKSTISEYFDKVGEYTNADEYVVSTGVSNEEAAKIVDKKRYEAIENREDFSFETVLSSHYKLDILREAKKNGYFIKCIFVLTSDPMINIARVRTRVAAGGHDVECNKILDRYEKSLANISELLNICDIMHVYDNSTQKPERIIRKHKSDISIMPNPRWNSERIIKLISGATN